MNAYLETFSKQRGIRYGASIDGTCLLVLEIAKGRHVLSISKNKDDQSESQGDDSVTIESPSATNSLGRVAVLDAQEKYIFASLADRRRLYVLPVPKQSSRITADQSIHNLEFEGELFGLKSFRNRLTSSSNDCSGIIAAVSVSGEVALLCAFGSRPEMRQRKVKVPTVDRVVYTTTYGDDHLIIVALTNSKLLFYAIHMDQGETLGSLNIQVLPEVFLPHAPDGAPPLRVEDGIIGFAAQRECAVVLYPGGYVHIIAPPDGLKPSITASFASCWCTPRSSGSRSRYTSSATLRHAMRLSQGRTMENELTTQEDRKRSPNKNHGVVSLGSSFFVIAYGDYVSIWDGIYCTGYSYIQAPASINFLFHDSPTGDVFVTSEEAVRRLTFSDKSDFASVTLGAAIKHKGVCDSIVISVQQNVESSPLRSQPVTVGPVQAAAESGGQIDRIFRGMIEKEEEQEVKQIRALLSRDAVPSAQTLIEKTHVYFKHKRKVRRGDHGTAGDLGLSKLPSERLAAVAVARCVFEIACGDSSYVVPFVDLLGTGVVSSEAVVSVLTVSDSWDMGHATKSLSFSSICDPLLAGDGYLNALEAVFVRIADLPERDIVKVFQFAVQLFVKTRSTNGSDTLKSWQCKRLLTRCMAHRVQQNRLVQIIKKLPFTDAITCISVLREFLSDDQELPRDQKGEVPRHIRTGQFVKDGITKEEALVYRGLGNWVDKDYEQRLERREIDETEACVRWISSLIDAHLAALIIDESGQQVATQVLDLIRIHRRESAALKGISGLVSHLVERNAEPSEEDPLYKVTSHEVPLSMALE